MYAYHNMIHNVLGSGEIVMCIVCTCRLVCLCVCVCVCVHILAYMYFMYSTVYVCSDWMNTIVLSSLYSVYTKQY